MYSVEVDQREGFRPSGCLCFPLNSSEGNIVGVLQATSSGDFTDETLSCLESVLSSIEAAVNHAQKNEHLGRKQSRYNAY